MTAGMPQQPHHNHDPKRDCAQSDNHTNNSQIHKAPPGNDIPRDYGVSAAMAMRRSVRAFSDKPVDESTIREILELAGLSPSGGNIQPWQIDVIRGETLTALQRETTSYIQRFGQSPKPEFATYPSPLAPPYHQRRADCGELMYQALGIAREDKPARIAQTMANYAFFGAPVGILLSMDRAMGMPQAIDIGIYLHALMLLAQERGLATCPQVSWTVFPQPVKTLLGMDDRRMLMAGLCLGYPAPDADVNQIHQPRAALENYVTFHR
ncbi:NADH dehydrogenase [Shewanella sp. NFH-SH190041]|uniref:nitroreductase n=1 Tax=Shewanella sp. NFH-SH190041 TaxID=2950245 RepID=UPI0021C39CB3|nr:nitroreductase [Shewanella sp. NFH-SH190041]BDM64399.1 NADH dehydrogenase [Shewanella sp. NFH-SH190041]